MGEQDFWNFLMHWGYLAILIAVFLEGEIFLLMVGIAAAGGIFNLPLAIAVAAIGAIIHDNTLFNISKSTGRKIIDKKPKLKDRVNRSFQLLDKYDYWAILAIRYMYGLRTVTLFVVGLSKIGRLKFFLLDTISSISWATLYLTLGYYAGHTIMDALHHVHIKEWIHHHKDETIFITLVVPAVLYIIFRILKRLKRLKRVVK